MTEHHKLMELMFDEAMRLRDEDDLTGARGLLVQIIERAASNDKVLLGHSHMQLGYIAQLRGEPAPREFHFQQAVMILPASDLASVSLYSTLFVAGRFREAFAEMVRLLRLRYSRKYDEMMGEPGFGDELIGELRELFLEARRLIAKRRLN